MDRKTGRPRTFPDQKIRTLSLQVPEEWLDLLDERIRQETPWPRTQSRADYVRTLLARHLLPPPPPTK